MQYRQCIYIVKYIIIFIVWVPKYLVSGMLRFQIEMCFYKTLLMLNSTKSDGLGCDLLKVFCNQY